MPLRGDESEEIDPRTRLIFSADQNIRKIFTILTFFSPTASSLRIKTGSLPSPFIAHLHPTGACTQTNSQAHTTLIEALNTPLPLLSHPIDLPSNANFCLP